jgi:hypothetical protein
MYVKKVYSSPWDGIKYFGLQLNKIYKLELHDYKWHYIYYEPQIRKQYVPLFYEDRSKVTTTVQEFISQFEFSSNSHLNLPDWW